MNAPCASSPALYSLLASMTIRLCHGRHAHDDQRDPVANQELVYPVRAPAVLGLDLLQLADRQEEKHGLGRHPHEAAQK